MMGIVKRTHDKAVEVDSQDCNATVDTSNYFDILEQNHVKQQENELKDLTFNQRILERATLSPPRLAKKERLRKLYELDIPKNEASL